jgi:hypothetical protein
MDGVNDYPWMAMKIIRSRNWSASQVGPCALWEGFDEHRGEAFAEKWRLLGIEGVDVDPKTIAVTSRLACRLGCTFSFPQSE